jgi:hypothetical protein
MKSFSQEIKDVLVAQGSGVFASTDPTAWAIYIGPLPDAPDKVIGLVDAGGPKASSFFNPAKSPLMRPRCQVMVRNANYIDGYNKLEDIRFILHQHPELLNLYSDDWNYLDVHATTEPMFLYQDSQKRCHWFLHMMAMREALVMPPVPSP